MKKAQIIGDSRLELVDGPEPEPAHDQLVVRVHRCGICGSDVLEYQHYKKFSECFGHEFSGVVTRAGPDVTRIKVGDHVAGYSYDAHGFAESVVVKECEAIPLPDSISMDEGALLEPIVVVLCGLRHSDFHVGDTCFVSGCGTIGLLAIQLLRAFGARRILAANRSEYRRNMALEFGADVVLDPTLDSAADTILSELDDFVDFALECVGIDKSMQLCSRVIRPGGTISQLGLTPDPIGLSTMDLFVPGRPGTGFKFQAMTPGDRNMFAVAVRMIQDKTIEPLRIVTHHFPLTSIAEAFSLATDRGAEAIKIIVDIDES